jgi:hypothetical protein
MDFVLVMDTGQDEKRDSCEALRLGCERFCRALGIGTLVAGALATTEWGDLRMESSAMQRILRSIHLTSSSYVKSLSIKRMGPLEL